MKHMVAFDFTKKILFVFLILSGCYVLPELPDWEIPISFSSLEEALDYVKDFTYSDKSKDDWNTPEETYKRGSGDCSDLSLLLAHILVIKLNIKNTEIIMGSFDDKSHAWVSINKVWYEPQLGLKILDGLYIAQRYFDYESALRRAEGDW